MSTIKTYVAYHATDESNVASIIENNFIYKPKDTHWLGFGSYFFLDKTLALFWGNNCPTTKYGQINKPAFIEVVVRSEDEFVCDMRELEKFNMVKQAFEIFWGSVYKIPCTAKYDAKFIEKLECAFFNWFATKKNLNCIICNFQKRELPTISNTVDNVFNKFRILYIETQMCVRNADCIEERKLLTGGVQQ